VYLAVKQVVGLTASPGAGSANNREAAAEHILELCANMDATDISTIRNEKNILELIRYANKPTEGLVNFTLKYLRHGDYAIK